MAIVATGQVTLTDLNDSKQLVSYVGSSASRTVIYSPPSTYVPNYATTNNVLTPQLFIAGTNSDIASQAESIRWFVQVGGSGTPVEITANTSDYTLGTGSVKTLTIKSNVLSSNNTMNYICEILFKDVGTGFDVLTKSEIELVKVTNGTDGEKGEDGTIGADGKDSVYAYVWTPEGNMIKNSEGSLEATVDVYEGSTTVAPTAFKWYVQDPTATTGSGGDADGGNGWRLLTDTYNIGVTGYKTKTIVIPADAIQGLESFMCVVTYDSVKYKGTVTVTDVSDPVYVEVVGVNTFKNGQGETSLRARVFRDGIEIDTDGSKYVYNWYLYDSDGTLDPNFGTGGKKVGKTIIVLATEVHSRANVVCELVG